MPKQYRVTEPAHQDMEEIVAFIARDNPFAAAKMMEAFYQAFEHLAQHPKTGHARPDLTKKPVRFWSIKPRYVVIYEEGIPLMISRVLSSDRDILKLL